MDARRDARDVDPASVLPDTMRAWSAAHPAATFAEIEMEATRQVAALRTELIQTALAAKPTAPAPPCPTCGRAMGRNGIHTRTIVTSQAEAVPFTDHRYRCSVCGTELSPPR